ncbi:MAG: ABC transporter ATP-binding protein, partial [Marinobacter sp.]
MSHGPDKEYEQLRVSGLHAFYGESHILHGIDMVVHRGELV